MAPKKKSGAAAHPSTSKAPSHAVTNDVGVTRMHGDVAGAGKRGGLRVIYYWAPGDQAFYMVYAYTKSEQGDLTPAQTRQLSRVVREEFK